MQIKIGIIVVYFGQWPEWINYFIKSCERNTEIDFIVFNDCQTSLSHYKNIRNVSLTLDEFNILASKKLGFKVRINNPYKICDFKPAIGRIFEDYLKGYYYWGFSDVDLIFGDLTRLIRRIIDNGSDFISLYRGFVSAPFFVVKNNSYLNSVYEIIKDYRNYLCMNEYCGIDENNKSAQKKPGNIKRALHVMKFFVSNFVNLIIFRPTKEEIKYDLYWYIKKKGITDPADFTEVIHLLSRKGNISSLFTGVMESDRSLCRKGIYQWRVEFAGGRLFIPGLKKKALMFHFPESKNNKKFGVSVFRGNFVITPHGILKHG
jgi:hypothetical protein